MKTSPAPGQLCRTQGCRNESAMNGFLCATMTAALSGEGMVRGLRYGQAALSLSVCVCVCVCVCARRRRVRVYTGKLPRNARIHAKDKEFESHSREPYPPPRLLWRNITTPSKGLAREPHWMELMEVLCAGYACWRTLIDEMRFFNFFFLQMNVLRQQQPMKLWSKC